MYYNISILCNWRLGVKFYINSNILKKGFLYLFRLIRKTSVISSRKAATWQIVFIIHGIQTTFHFIRKRSIFINAHMYLHYHLKSRSTSINWILWSLSKCTRFSFEWNLLHKLRYYSNRLQLLLFIYFICCYL